MPGEAEVEHDRVGMVPGRERRASSPVGAGVGLVAAGAQVGGQGPEDRGFVVDDEDAGHGGHGRGYQLDDHRRAAAGRVLDDELAVHGPGEPAGHGQSEPDTGAAARGGVVEALERLEDPLPVVRVDARSLVDDPQRSRGRRWCRPRPRPGGRRRG